MEQYENLVLEYLNENINEEQEVPVLELDENNIGVKFHILTSKDVTLLRGVTGCGKTQVCSFLIKQLVLKKADPFFKRMENGRPFLVFVLETEMSKYNIKKNYIKNAFPEYNKNELRDKLKISDRLNVISFKKFSLEERKEKLIKLSQKLNKEYENYNIVILIDNIGSFSSDLNSGQNNELVNVIFSALSEFTVLIVMHTNHKENSNSKNNATGLLGSVVERLSPNIIEISKNESKRISLKLVKSKTQDDKLSHVVDFIQDESDEKYFVKDVVAGKLFNTEKQKVKNTPKLSDEEIASRVYEFIKNEPSGSMKRTRKCIAEIFSEYKQAAFYDKIKDLVTAKVLIDSNKSLYHKDEMPF